MKIRTKKKFSLPFEIYRPAPESNPKILPFFTASVSAGFPSPADDYVERHLDLNELLVKHPAATFFVRVQGDSMRDANILSGDVLIVDRSLEPSHGKIIVAILEGEFTVKRLLLEKGQVYLAPANAAFGKIKVDADSQFQVWGVVTYVIHKSS